MGGALVCCSALPPSPPPLSPLHLLPVVLHNGQREMERYDWRAERRDERETERKAGGATREEEEEERMRRERVQASTNHDIISGVGVITLTSSPPPSLVLSSPPPSLSSHCVSSHLSSLPLHFVSSIFPLPLSSRSLSHSPILSSPPFLFGCPQTLSS